MIHFTYLIWFQAKIKQMPAHPNPVPHSFPSCSTSKCPHFKAQDKLTEMLMLNQSEFEIASAAAVVAVEAASNRGYNKQRRSLWLDRVAMPALPASLSVCLSHWTTEIQ